MWRAVIWRCVCQVRTLTEFALKEANKFSTSIRVSIFRPDKPQLRAPSQCKQCCTTALRRQWQCATQSLTYRLGAHSQEPPRQREPPPSTASPPSPRHSSNNRFYPEPRPTCRPPFLCFGPPNQQRRPRQPARARSEFPSHRCLPATQSLAVVKVTGRRATLSRTQLLGRVARRSLRRTKQYRRGHTREPAGLIIHSLTRASLLTERQLPAVQKLLMLLLHIPHDRHGTLAHRKEREMGGVGQNSTD